MKYSFWKSFGFGLVLILGVYWIWTNLGKGTDLPQYLKLEALESYGDSTNAKGNLLGIQAYVTPADYATPERFKSKVEFYLQKAQRRGWLTPHKTIVVFPEYFGTWLVVQGEKSSIYSAKTVQEGLTTLVLTHLPSFIRHWLTAPSQTPDKIRHAVFAMKATEMAQTYQRVFAELAHRYQVIIVAGSILLPNPTVKEGKLKIGSGALVNTSALFHSNGQIDPQLSKKAHPITDEMGFVCQTPASEIPVYQTPIGRLGVLVCADAWYADAYKTLKAKNATLLAVPSFSTGKGLWHQPWMGYSGSSTPTEALKDVGKITLGEAWAKYAMLSRAPKEADLQQGINVFLQGQLWDLSADGTTLILNQQGTPTRHFGGSGLINFWL